MALQPIGKTYSQRKSEFDTISFIHIRNLACRDYRILNYNDTLHDREGTKDKVLEFELQNGVIFPDGTDPSVLAAVPVQPPQQIIVPNIPIPIVPVTPVGELPAMVFTQTNPPASEPQAQPAPATPPPGRKRRTAAAAAPSAPVETAPVAPPVFSAAPSFTAPAANPFAPTAPVAPPVIGASVQQPGVNDDVVKKLFEALDSIKFTAVKTSEQLAEVTSQNKMLFNALHYIYLSQPALLDHAQKATNGKAMDLETFKTYVFGLNPR